MTTDAVTMEHVRAMSGVELNQFVRQLLGWHELAQTPDWSGDLNAAITLMPDDCDWSLNRVQSYGPNRYARIEWGTGGEYGYAHAVEEESPRGQEARAVTLAFVAWRLAQ